MHLLQFLIFCGLDPSWDRTDICCPCSFAIKPLSSSTIFTTISFGITYVKSKITKTYCAWKSLLHLLGTKLVALTPPNLSALEAVPKNLCAVGITPPVALIVFLSVTPWSVLHQIWDNLLHLRIYCKFYSTYNEDYFIINYTNNYCSVSSYAISNCSTWNGVTLSPAPCGSYWIKLVPLWTYNCSLLVSQKSPSANPAGLVALISAPPVVLHLVPS